MWISKYNKDSIQPGTLTDTHTHPPRKQEASNDDKIYNNNIAVMTIIRIANMY